jgi:hypothetical protein
VTKENTVILERIVFLFTIPVGPDRVLSPPRVPWTLWQPSLRLTYITQHASTLKMDAAFAYVTLVSTYKTTYWNNPEDHIWGER